MDPARGQEAVGGTPGNRCCWLIAAILCQLALACAADGPPGAAIASAHPLATRAGLETLQNGGNAFDAAVTVSAALAVVEPYSSGIGGGGFWLLHRASDGRQIMVDGREKAPGAAYRRLYLDEHDNVREGASLEGALAAGIPGLAAGLGHLATNFGRLPIGKSLAPAVRLAREGFPVTQGYRDMAGWRLKALQKHPETARLYLANNALPEFGHPIIQEDLGNLLEQIGMNGPGYFYQGQFAQRLVEGVRAGGGIWSLEDLRNYVVAERAPIVTEYRGIRVVSAPPPSSGGIVLVQALEILEHEDLAGIDHITRMHIVIEAMRRAYRDRAVYLGDPDFVEVPTDRLLAPDYLAGLALTIDPKRATPSAELGDTPGLSLRGESTTHFSIMDTDGNRVAGTLSINLPFGAAFVPPGTGVLLNDEMDDFSIKPNTPNAYGLVGDHANSVAANKRPLSSMTPTFVETEDRIGILGTPGGSRIISMVLLGVLDFGDGHGPESWVKVRRYHHQYLPDEVQFEPHGLVAYEQEELRRLGHTLKQTSYSYGDMHAVMWDRKNNQIFAAADPRGEGKAALLPDP
ncbi:MAG: gamma-glutamyltransferase [Gammaproteobacteria bacterium]|nr:gamma-glutamyltransferase [Gammaproteobacteria bacterium]